jgi:tRNA threonylcarbamoyladenosine biosynthesis protein TsaE
MMGRPYDLPDIISGMSVLSASAFDFLSESPDQTRGLGKRLGALLQPGDVICLQGELAAGKTTFVQGVAQGWGSLDAVSSPTFILVNVYRRPDGEQLFHFDTYRLDSAPEAEELDIDAMLLQGALVIEWPERMQSVLPAEQLWIKLEHVDEAHRKLHFEPRGARAAELLEGLRDR